MYNEIVLSDNEPLLVRQLGIFELDHILPPALGILTYKVKMLTGEEREAEFDHTTFKEPPERPDVDEAELVYGSRVWHKYRTWQLYQAAIHHSNQRFDLMDDFCERVLQHILDNCIQAGHLHRIVTDEDVDKVCEAGLVPQLRREHLAKVLRETYRAKFDDQELFEAMDQMSGGLSSYDAIRLWENQLAIEMRMSDAEYALIPLEERARRVCAAHIRDWITHLELDAQKKQRKGGV